MSHVVSRSIEQVGKTLAAAGLERYFKVMLGQEDYENSKPAPDGYLKAARLLGVDPGACVGFEDAPFGFQALKAAQYLMTINVMHMDGYVQS
eukprot:scaffold4120_cov400-Prasinococcus_capsulatus_cf.AAC.23